MSYFGRKLGKMLQNLSSAAVVSGALRVKWELYFIISGIRDIGMNAVWLRMCSC